MHTNIYTLKEKPELLDGCLTLLHQCWPAFMLQGAIKDTYRREFVEPLADYYFAMQAGEEVVAMGQAIPLFWDATLNGLPGGWDVAVEKGMRHEETPNTLSALSITISPNHRGKGFAAAILAKMKESAEQNGLKHVIVPLRPTLKPLYPLMKFETYVSWMRENGEHFDPWIRTHMRVGGKILKPVANSKVIEATIPEWEEWTGLRFYKSGHYVVPNALEPIYIDTEKNTGYYAEPNLWIQHM